MFKRFFCLFCIIFLLPIVPAASEDNEAVSFDFDLTFSLNTDAFSPVSRLRAKGYADMLSRLGIKGNIIWNETGNSFELVGSLFYRDKPDTVIPFRVYGLPNMIYMTSPAINNEIILLNMSAFMEFAAKAKENLGVPLPYLAFLYPPTTDFTFAGMDKIWREEIGTVTKDTRIPASTFDKAAKRWETEMDDNPYLSLWISALADGSECPEAVNSEFSNLVFYPAEYVTGGKPVTVSIGKGTETWQNAAGQILYSREETDHSLIWTFSLPETEYRYQPYLSFFRVSDQAGTFSLRLNASYIREGTEKPAKTSSAGAVAFLLTGIQSDNADPGDGSNTDAVDEEANEDDESFSWPDRLLEISVTGSGLPEKFPQDAVFSLDIIENGALFPNLAFRLDGETKSDGFISLSVKKPSSGDDETVEMFRAEGTVTPVEPSMIPRYFGKVFHGAYNLFSLNEEKVGRLKKDIMPGLLSTALGFIAEAPASFVQSFLDDFTDLGLLGLFANQ